jgi:predicted glycoside hydrolase/deacetylase ChbG (UPF0249 family)
MKKRIVLCADDYGQAPPVSQGILALVERGLLSAVSCLVNTAYWQAHSRWLAPFCSQIDVGLHFNLTEGKALSSEYAKAHGQEMLSLPKLLSRALIGNLDEIAIAAECHAQLDQFQMAVGRLPDYLDGHHHIHQFPVIRDAVLQVYQQRLGQQQAYVRLVNPAIRPSDFLFNIKKCMIRATGTKPFRNLLIKNKIPFNQSFAGIYPFTKAPRYEALFPIFLKEITDKGLIMCHPALAQAGSQGPLEKAKYAEFNYLMGPEFLAACCRHHVQIQRFADCDDEKP